MTNRKIPSVRIVIGNVKIIKIGRTRIFRMDKIKLAMIAEPKLETSNPSKYPAIATNKRALIKIPINHFELNPE
jgi:hypothetical protein